MHQKAKAAFPEAQNPLIIRSHRLMEAFAKSSDERDFYVDRVEGFIVYVDLDKSDQELAVLEKELAANFDRYYMVPKLTFYETKKIMEGFVNEKVYDIDVKEKLFDIIQSKEARENFLEYVYDHHAEYEKWQQYYQERSRIRIIEWLRQHHFHFVFEEDLDMPGSLIEKLKRSLFDKRVGKEIEVARKALTTKAKSYYSNEALNPRPKRGRPPKQSQKMELEPQMTTDIFTTVPAAVRPFLFTPEITSAFEVTFSARFETGKELVAHRRQAPPLAEFEESMNNISQKLAMLRELSSHWMDKETQGPVSAAARVEKEKKVVEELETEEKALFKKLEGRRHEALDKMASGKKPIATKAVKQLVLKQDRAKKKATLPVKASKPVKPPAKKTAGPERPPVKRILPKAKKAAAATKAPKKSPEKAKPRPAKKLTKKMPIKTAPKNSLKTNSGKKKLLKRTTPKTTKAKKRK